MSYFIFICLHFGGWQFAALSLTDCPVQFCLSFLVLFFNHTSFIISIYFYRLPTSPLSFFFSLPNSLSSASRSYSTSHASLSSLTSLHFLFVALPSDSFLILKHCWDVSWIKTYGANVFHHYNINNISLYVNILAEYVLDCIEDGHHLIVNESVRKRLHVLNQTYGISRTLVVDKKTFSFVRQVW